MANSIFVICVGACLGALSRWGLGALLNKVFPLIPLGTLVANLVGGYIIGFSLCVLAHNAALAPEWRLGIVTGFLGSLTTFSSFSAEAVFLIQQGRLGWAGGLVALHVCGSLALTFLGMATFSLLRPFLPSLGS